MYDISKFICAVFIHKDYYSEPMESLMLKCEINIKFKHLLSSRRTKYIKWEIFFIDMIIYEIAEKERCHDYYVLTEYKKFLEDELESRKLINRIKRRVIK